MAGFNPKSLRVLGINVAVGGVANLPGLVGFEPAVAQAPTTHLSRTRHLAYPDADAETAPRHERTDLGTLTAAERVGRPGYCAGVPQRQHPARIAGPAIPFGWPGFAGARAKAVGGDPGKVTALKRSSSMPSQHSQLAAKQTLQTAGLHRPMQEMGSFAGSMSAAWRPVSGMFRSAAQGK